jgi:predicted Zn finger-like uncharacterized protein
MRIRCPTCRKSYEVRDGLPAAAQVRCAICGQAFSLSRGLEPEAAPAEAAPAEAAPAEAPGGEALPLALDAGDAPAAAGPADLAQAPSLLDEIASQIHQRPTELTTMRFRRQKRR